MNACTRSWRRAMRSSAASSSPGPSRVTSAPSSSKARAVAGPIGPIPALTRTALPRSSANIGARQGDGVHEGLGGGGLLERAAAREGQDPLERLEREAGLLGDARGHVERVRLDLGGGEDGVD